MKTKELILINIILMLTLLYWNVSNSYSQAFTSDNFIIINEQYSNY